MIPTVDERLASVVRALTDVVIPSLPPEAGLALEQIQLSIGHVQIIRAQLDAMPAYEQEELADVLLIGRALQGLEGGAETRAANAELGNAIAGGAEVKGPAESRKARNAIHDAITRLVRAISADGTNASRNALSRIIIEKEKARATKDRHWFAPFGFDSIAAG